jgi:hypothetical protein
MGKLAYRLAGKDHARIAVVVPEEADSGYNEGEQEAGGGDPVAGEAVTAVLAKPVRQFLPGRLPVVQDLVRLGIRLVQQAAPF